MAFDFPSIEQTVCICIGVQHRNIIHCRSIKLIVEMSAENKNLFQFNNPQEKVTVKDWFDLYERWLETSHQNYKTIGVDQ